MIGEKLCWGTIDNDGVGVVVPNHVDQGNLVDVEDRVMEPTYDGTFADGENGVIGIIDVDHLLVKNCDVVGIGKFTCAEEQMLTYSGGDVEFVGRRSDVEWIFSNLCGWDDFAVE